MKRSRHVGFLIASASVLALAGCYEEDPPVVKTDQAVISQPAAQAGDKVFANVDACLSDIAADATDRKDQQLKCVADWEAAKADHEKNAPHFKTLAECQAEFGPEACGTQPVVNNSGSGDSSSSFFMPLLMGYMIGNALSSPSPAYYDRDGGYRSYSRSGSAAQRLRSSTAFVNPNGSTTVRSGATRAVTAPAKSSVKATAPSTSTMSQSTRSRSSGFGASRSSGGSRSFGG